jgi:hypothetical protein
MARSANVIPRESPGTECWQAQLGTPSLVIPILGEKRGCWNPRSGLGRMVGYSPGNKRVSRLFPFTTDNARLSPARTRMASFSNRFPIKRLCESARCRQFKRCRGLISTFPQTSDTGFDSHRPLQLQTHAATSFSAWKIRRGLDCPAAICCV